MSKQTSSATTLARPRHGRAIALTIAISALVVACVSGLDDQGAVQFRDDCDGPDEYIDENGEEVICIYTEEPGGGNGGGDPCMDFPWLCGYAGYDDDGGYGDGGGEAGGGEAGGGEAGGGEEPPPPPCTPAGDDCTSAKRCCGSNVCAYGGERDTTWCQPLEPSAWQDACLDAKSGTPVYKNGALCHYTNSGMFNATCLSVQGQSCVIGYNGDCGEGTYTMQIRDVAQAEPGTCKG